MRRSEGKGKMGAWRPPFRDDNSSRANQPEPLIVDKRPGRLQYISKLMADCVLNKQKNYQAP